MRKEIKWLLLGFMAILLVAALLVGIALLVYGQRHRENTGASFPSTQSTASSTTTQDIPGSSEGNATQSTQPSSAETTQPSSTETGATQPTEQTEPENTTAPLSEEEQARQIAQETADEILAMPELDSDFLKLAAATRTMNILCRECELVDSGENWDTAYGFFVEKKWSQPSCIRALGMVLDALGYEWEFVNEDNNQHKWVIVYDVDGQIAFADPNVVGLVGYGDRYEDDAYYYDWEEGLVFYG